MHILCTGCGGFIGGYLYRSLAKTLQPDDKLVGVDCKAEYTYDSHLVTNTSLHWKNILVECHLESEAWVSRLLNGFQPDVIYHFAGCATVSSHAKQVWESNVTTTFNLLNNLLHGKAVKFVLASSVLADDPQSVYGASKAAAENLVNAYSNLDLIEPVIFRLVAVAGAYNTHGAVRDIVKKFMVDDIVQVFGKDPGSYKPHTHVEDVVNIIQYIVNSNNDIGGPITISPRYDGMNINQICEIINRFCPVNKPWKFNGNTWPGDQEKLIVNSWVLQRLLSERKDLLLPSSAVAVEKAVKDILRIEYGVVPTWEGQTGE